ncbi:MAG: hypothetical protein KDF24_02275 [Rhodocyclaceae bacterium]|nr:hypothetical protein [Rhodocyclaceae bacterium]MCB1961982.1 hypothetical protein [Rhodocyclaceae bacterium]
MTKPRIFCASALAPAIAYTTPAGASVVGAGDLQLNVSGEGVGYARYTYSNRDYGALHNWDGVLHEQYTYLDASTLTDASSQGPSDLSGYFVVHSDYGTGTSYFDPNLDPNSLYLTRKTGQFATT